MKLGQWLPRVAKPICLALAVWVSTTASAGWFGLGGTSWKEEVLLHDGRKIIVERSQSYGGNHEIGQTPPIKEQEVRFQLPGSKKTIAWKSDYSDELGRSNFRLVALHILDSTPYVVASPNLCLSYNKWGRPNPPYVFYRFDGRVWNRIPISEFPPQFKSINVVVNTKGEEAVITSQKLVSSESVTKINSSLEQPEYKTILRERVKTEATTCPDYNSQQYRSPKAPIPIAPPAVQQNQQ